MSYVYVYCIPTAQQPQPGPYMDQNQQPSPMPRQPEQSLPNPKCTGSRAQYSYQHYPGPPPPAGTQKAQGSPQSFAQTPIYPFNQPHPYYQQPATSQKSNQQGWKAEYKPYDPYPSQVSGQPPFQQPNTASWQMPGPANPGHHFPSPQPFQCPTSPPQYQAVPPLQPQSMQFVQPNSLQNVPAQQPQSTTPSTADATRRISGSCTKYLETTACGHKPLAKYEYCNNSHIHNNTPTENEYCYRRNKSIWPSFPPKMSVGTNFCNDSCRALQTGWQCCTCNFLYVTGKQDSSTGRVVHKTKDGDLHAFCGKCRVDFQIQLAQNLPAKVNNIHFNLNAGNVLGNLMGLGGLS